MSDQLEAPPQVESQPVISSDATSGAAPIPQSQPSAATSPEWVGIADYARGRGIDLSRFQNDEEALNHFFGLHQRYPQVEQMAQYGNEYLSLQQSQDWQNYQKWRQQQQAPQEQKSWFSPPMKQHEYDRALAQYMTVDPTGNRVPKPGAPSSIVSKIGEYEAYIQDYTNRLVHNPQEALKEPVQEWARQLINDEMQRQRQHNASLEVVQRHANWIFAQGPGGVPMYGQFTPQGAAFLNEVKLLEQSGIKDPYKAEELALTILYARQNMGNRPQQTPQTPPQNPPPQRPPANRIAQHVQPTPPKAKPKGSSLATQMQDALKAQGINQIDW